MSALLPAQVGCIGVSVASLILALVLDYLKTYRRDR